MSGLPRAADPLQDACGDTPNRVCRWVFERTDNGTLGVAADWLIGKPIQIAIVLLLAWVLRRAARRWTRRVVRRMLDPRQGVADQLDALGLGVAKRIVEPEADPRREARAATVASVCSGAATILISFVAFLVVLGIIGIQLAPLIAGAGIAGIAVAFGAQSLVRDWINGVFILIEDQFGIGDDVEIGTVSGVIEKVTLRTTVVRAGDGGVWYIPNGQINQVGNLSQVWSVAVVDVTVEYGSDIATTTALLDAAAAAVRADPVHADDMLADPQVLGVQALSPLGATLRVTVRTAPGRQWAVQRSLRQEIQSTLLANGIHLASTAPPAGGPPPA